MISRWSTKCRRPHTHHPVDRQAMPRRKQDKPQHFEEDTEMEQMGQSENTMTRCADGEDPQITDNKEHSNEELVSSVETTADAAEPAEITDAADNAEIDNVSSEEDFGSDAAVISNTEWLSVKATLSTLQQQMQMLRLQQFQLMQLLASKSQSNSSLVNAPNGSLVTGGISKQEDSNEDTNTADDIVPVTENSLEVKVSDDKVDDVTVEEPSQASFNETEVQDCKTPESGSIEPETEESEPVSYDCSHCSAVLPSPELLKLHMLSHSQHSTKSEPTSDSVSVGGTGAYSLGSSVGLNGSLPTTQPPLPPSYQSVISDLTNDDSLEEYMEIQKPENTHLEQLAKSMDGCITDPNQCLICKRVLSCKSALMMHYRTHTGERPFKCKLCSRAFTTKGNLKTHMGVHRAKPPMRLLHNCPVCNKQFTNALVLNQHMKLHTDEANRKREMLGSEKNVGLMSEEKRPRFSLESGIKPELSEVYHSSDHNKKTNQLNHLGLGFPFDFSMLPSMSGHLRYAEAFARQWDQLHQFSMFNPLAAATNPAAMFVPGLSMPGPATNIRLPMFDQTNGNNRQEKTTPSNPEINISIPTSKSIEVDDSANKVMDEKKTPDANQPTTSPKSDQSWGSNEMSNSSTMKLDPPPGTTCDICAKTFACRSALEIHYRSHTKQRPFKCDLCDKAFTTRGNMKQHILTHKTDDLHWASREKTSPCLRPSSSLSIDRSLSTDEMKRSNNKHQCPTCLKHFSSASAVQIHFRTHTGDRPFKCTVCSKAFTTKGNLKVHMGTHMWNSSPSRRGRRLSVEGNEVNSDCNFNDIPTVSTPSILNNNNLEWNSSINQAAIMKASLLASPASMMVSNPYLFVNANGQRGSEENSKSWFWQVTCHICNKECQSPSALELHIKTHVANENSSPKSVTA